MTLTPAHNKPQDYKKLIEHSKKYGAMEIEAIRGAIVTLRMYKNNHPTNTRITLSENILNNAISRGLLNKSQSMLTKTDAIDYVSKRLSHKKRNDHITAFQTQKTDLKAVELMHQSQRISATLNAKESPLIWLMTHKNKHGQTHITPTQFAAGEYLQSLFTRAGLSPKLGINWSDTAMTGIRGSKHANPSDTSLAARDKLNALIKELGPEFASPLLDVCCFSRSLEELEKHYGWPERSAKVVLKLGLDKLARTCGLS